MDEKNPSKNIAKLRQGAGADTVTPIGTFDQFEPLTSYGLGATTMSVNMTSTGVGVGTGTAQKTNTGWVSK
jgi:hypothetical protein